MARSSKTTDGSTPLGTVGIQVDLGRLGTIEGARPPEGLGWSIANLEKARGGNPDVAIDEVSLAQEIGETGAQGSDAVPQVY